jgi:hypothetical protein
MAAAYHSGQEQLFLFGGSDAGDIPLGETWVYSGTTWSQLTPATAPLSRTAVAMVYAPISQTLFLFGGQASTTYFNDLWQFDGSDWSQVSVNGGSPPARAYHALTYDEDEQVLWLFGGRTVTGTLLADLWRYDLATATWTEINDSGPSARMAHVLVYQPEWGELVLMGGAAGDGDTLLSDTWHYQVGVGWEEASPATSLPATAYHQAVYDSNSQGILLFTDGQTWQYQ